MSDRARLILTGVAAVAVIGMTTAFGGHGLSLLWSSDGPKRQHEVRVLPGLAGFAGVSLDGPDNVVVTTGKQFAVSVEGDARALDQIDIAVRDGMLQIARRPGGRWSGDRDTSLIRVAVPRLGHAALVGSGNLRIARMDGPQVDARLTGSGNLSIGDLRAKQVALMLSGSGNLSVAGKADTVTIDQIGSGDMRAARLDARTARIKLVGSGDVRALAHDKASVSILGSGDAHIIGTTQCQISKTGSGEASCKS